MSNVAVVSKKQLSKIDTPTKEEITEKKEEKIEKKEENEQKPFTRIPGKKYVEKAGEQQVYETAEGLCTLKRVRTQYVDNVKALIKAKKIEGICKVVCRKKGGWVCGVTPEGYGDDTAQAFRNECKINGFFKATGEK